MWNLNAVLDVVGGGLEQTLWTSGQLTSTQRQHTPPSLASSINQARVRDGLPTLAASRLAHDASAERNRCTATPARVVDLSSLANTTKPKSADRLRGQ
eukprot:scaffold246630_cov29-Prasinocladus_malaysianus.AAC.1